MRRHWVPIVIAGLLAALSACSSDTPAASNDADTTVAPTVAPTVVDTAPASDDVPTVCATDDAGDRKTVTIDVDDDSDGLGRFGLKTPTPLPAGSIRLVVNSVEDNPDPVTVIVASGAATVFEFVAVQPGVLCAADVDLDAGDYTVNFGDKSKTFTVDPAS